MLTIYSTDIIWVSLAYLLTTSIGLIIVGRVSDIFGRRWWFIGGCAIGTLGCIIASVAPSVPALIAAETLIGIGGSVQISYACQFQSVS
jgi:MFS family permease